jgi:hypothetical protein
MNKEDSIHSAMNFTRAATISLAAVSCAGWERLCFMECYDDEDE